MTNKIRKRNLHKQNLDEQTFYERQLKDPIK